jgi:hypothetical protein
LAPAHVHVEPAIDLLKSQYDAGVIQFKLPSNPANRQRALAVLAHEYGHAIFDVHFRIGIRTKAEESLYLGFTEKMIAAKHGVPEAEARWKTLLEASSDQAESARQEWLRLLSAADREQIPFRMHHLSLQVITLPFNELFADHVAVALGKRPSAMAEGLRISKQYPFFAADPDADYITVGEPFRRPVHPTARPRDASAQIDYKNWISEDGSKRIYTLLDPARSQIWKKYRKQLQSQPGLFLKSYLDATAQLIRRRGGVGGWREPHPERLNREFVFLLREAIRKNGLKR